MSVEANSKHYKAYYKQVLKGKRTDGILGKNKKLVAKILNMSRGYLITINFQYISNQRN